MAQGHPASERGRSSWIIGVDRPGPPRRAARPAPSTRQCRTCWSRGRRDRRRRAKSAPDPPAPSSSSGETLQHTLCSLAATLSTCSPSTLRLRATALQAANAAVVMPWRPRRRFPSAIRRAWARPQPSRQTLSRGTCPLVTFRASNSIRWQGLLLNQSAIAALNLSGSSNKHLVAGAPRTRPLFEGGSVLVERSSNPARRCRSSPASGGGVRKKK